MRCLGQQLPYHLIIQSWHRLLLWSKKHQTQLLQTDPTVRNRMRQTLQILTWQHHPQHPNSPIHPHRQQLPIQRLSLFWDPSTNELITSRDCQLDPTHPSGHAFNLPCNDRPQCNMCDVQTIKNSSEFHHDTVTPTTPDHPDPPSKPATTITALVNKTSPHTVCIHPSNNLNKTLACLLNNYKQIKPTWNTTSRPIDVMEERQNKLPSYSLIQWPNHNKDYPQENKPPMLLDNFHISARPCTTIIASCARDGKISTHSFNHAMATNRYNTSLDKCSSTIAQTLT